MTDRGRSRNYFKNDYRKENHRSQNYYEGNRSYCRGKMRYRHRDNSHDYTRDNSYSKDRSQKCYGTNWSYSKDR